MPHPIPHEYDGQIDVLVGSFRVVDSLVLLSHGNSPITYIVTPESETLKISIIFIDMGKSLNIKTELSDDSKSISFIVPKNIVEFSIGAKEPLKIGTVVGKSLLITLKCTD